MKKKCLKGEIIKLSLDEQAKARGGTEPPKFKNPTFEPDISFGVSVHF
ncbi:hypothetical protein [Labilibaculum euxinus]|uniref:Uncharacterized protein n=1 Tax=Labilibaculum euxinus TaxID=2686357 RepID=A0A7M4D0Z4_9BACT|nr:hypothetical protein [Labilibaculum euxinus]MUP36323.1 hypothetical protein [Labilibaculum euxinus]MVB05528.1 hypothetical protein [Labilibaculum euxinus]